MKITVLQSGVEAVVIQDGKVLERNLKATENNMEWLKKDKNKKKKSIKKKKTYNNIKKNNKEIT